MKGKCRQAGTAILDQEAKIRLLTKEVDRLSEENGNLKTMMGSKDGK